MKSKTLKKTFEKLTKCAVSGEERVNFSALKIQKCKKTQKRKWSQKYKKLIDCNQPHGFSQKQYCKYRI
jgi:hypothetical protein